jgi:N-dimethylarginine dimethylaminohydrolase
MTLDYGSRSMTQPLRRVLVRPPQAADSVRWREYGWRAEPNLAAAVAEHEALREILEDAGAEVVVTEGERGNPDAIYAYDPLLVGEHGAVLLRPGKDSRLGEAAALEDDLAEAGIPIAGRIEAPGTIDGGDTLWLDRETLLVGRGYRTNAAGVEQLAALFPDAEVRSYDLPHWNGRAEVMHLMSLISPLADEPRARLSAARARSPDRAPARARDRDRRGAGRGVRDDGPERARARPASCAGARRE